MKKHLKLSLMITLLSALSASNIAASKPSIAFNNQLMEAIINRNAAEVKLLLDRGADPNAELKPSSQVIAASIAMASAAGRTPPPIATAVVYPLQLAIANESPAIVKLLLNAGADPNRKNFKEKSAQEQAEKKLEHYKTVRGAVPFRVEITNLREIVDILRNFKR